MSFLCFGFWFVFSFPQITIRCVPCKGSNVFAGAFRSAARPSLGYLAGEGDPIPHRERCGIPVQSLRSRLGCGSFRGPRAKSFLGECLSGGSIVPSRDLSPCWLFLHSGRVLLPGWGCTSGPTLPLPHQQVGEQEGLSSPTARSITQCVQSSRYRRCRIHLVGSRGAPASLIHSTGF